MKKSNQEIFWEGKFGDDYISRNHSDFLFAPNLNLFSEITRRMNEKPKQWIEYGANVGNNLKAIKAICPECKTIGVEINEKASEILRKYDFCDQVINKSMFNINTQDLKSDVSMTKGVLIHISPELLSDAYRILYETSNKYILLVEYYNPLPLEVEYRGNKEKMYKRDFASELIEQYPDLSLIDYGFKYHKDPVFPQDDLTWFLITK